MLIIAIGEHGDRDTPRALKRLIVGVMWLFGVVLIAQFTATCAGRSPTTHAGLVQAD